MTIHFAPIAPLNILNTLHEQGHLGPYNLFEASDVIRLDRPYIDLSNEIRQTNEKTTIILDTGIMQGEAVTPAGLIDAIEFVRPTHVILPDVLGDWQSTVLFALGTIKMLEHTKKKHKFEWMYVTQGKTMQEALRGYFEVRNIAPEVRCVGIPYNLGDLIGSRVPIVKAFAKRSEDIDLIHLLGLNENFLIDCWWCNEAKITVGIDSSVPVIAGQQGGLLPLLDLTLEQRRKLTQQYRSHRDRNWWMQGKWSDSILPQIGAFRDAINTTHRTDIDE